MRRELELSCSWSELSVTLSTVQKATCIVTVSHRYRICSTTKLDLKIVEGAEALSWLCPCKDACVVFLDARREIDEGLSKTSVVTREKKALADPFTKALTCARLQFDTLSDVVSKIRPLYLTGILGMLPVSSFM
ncbi:hypothetical protein Tco_0672521 [Tanacetum coccineum]